MADAPRNPESGDGGVRTAPITRLTEADTALFGSLLRGRFLVERRLGAGGQGDVYLARDQKLRRRVAIKRSRHSWLLSHEGEIQSALQHPNIATVFDLVGSGSECFLVEEFVPGTTLRKRMRGPMRWAEFLPIARGCLAGLEAASQRDIVHCDIKPNNIVVTGEGLPKILDFGLARKADPPDDDSATTSRSGTDDHPRGGTSGYMAPEALRDEPLDPRSDVFSLGVVFYEMLTGTHPFRKGSRIATDTSTLSDSPPELHSVAPRIPGALSRVVMRMIERDPRKRPSAAAALREIGRWEKLRIKVRTLVTFGAPALAVAAAVALVIMLRTQPGTAPPPEFVTLGEFRADGTARLEAFAAGFREEVRDRLADIPGLQIVDPESGFVTDLAVTAVVSDQPVGDPYDARSRISIDYSIRETSGRVYWQHRVEERIAGLFRALEEVAGGVSYSLARKHGLERLPLGGTPPAASAPVFARYLEARGRLEGGDDELAAAIPLLQSVVNDAPAFPMARVRLAEVLWARAGNGNGDGSRSDDRGGGGDGRGGDGDGGEPASARRAEEVALAAVGAAADLPAAYLVLGDVLLGTGREEEAFARYRSAIELDPAALEPYLRLANALDAYERAEEARTTLDSAISARPDDWVPLDRLGIHFYRRGQLESSVESFREAARLSPGNSRTLAKLGAMLGLLGRKDEAEDAYRKSIAIKPDFVAYTNWGTLLRNAGEVERAAALYEEAVRGAPDDYRLWAALASAYDLLPGRREDTARAARRAIELGEAVSRSSPGDADILVRLSQLHATIGDLQSADDALERALEIAAEDAGVLLNAALIFEGRGERARALEMVGRALRAGCQPGWVLEEPGLNDLAADPAYGEMLQELEGAG